MLISLRSLLQFIALCSLLIFYFSYVRRLGVPPLRLATPSPGDIEADRTTTTDVEADRTTTTDVEADRTTTTDVEADRTTTTDVAAVRPTSTESEADRITLADPSVRALCDRTEWTDGLWLRCHSFCGPNETSICGGLNNARNRIQTCVRLAIDAGSGLILPRITTRDDEDLRNTNTGDVCPEVFMDVSHLRDALREQCPQLQLRDCGDVSGIDTVLDSSRRDYLSPAHHNGTFQELVASVLAAANIAAVKASHPVAVAFGDPYIAWNYAEAGELLTVRKGLFKALHYNPDLLGLGQQILQSPELRDGFIGVHLRGENDWPAQFGSSDDQIRLYSAELQALPPAAVYVSCGDATAIDRFRAEVAPHGFTVHDKWTLMAGQSDMRARIDALDFDQKAVVEYHVLMAARVWLGILTSSMSSLIAYARTVDDSDDFFATYIFPSSERSGIYRHFPDAPAVRGNNFTRLVVVSGDDIMDAFP